MGIITSSSPWPRCLQALLQHLIYLHNNPNSTNDCHSTSLRRNWNPQSLRCLLKTTAGRRWSQNSNPNQSESKVPGLPFY